MEKTNPHRTHSYSQDQLLITAFGHEIRNTIRLMEDTTNELAVVEAYLQKRIDEIKERWK